MPFEITRYPHLGMVTIHDAEFPGQCWRFLQADLARMTEADLQDYFFEPTANFTYSPAPEKQAELVAVALAARG